MDRDYIEIEQFKLFVESAERMSDKRMNNNNFLMTLNTAYIGFLAVASLDALPFYILGIAICVIWIYMNKNYRQRNEIKYEIINECEKGMGRFFSKEYENTIHLCSLSFYENTIVGMFIMMYIFIYLDKINIMDIIINYLRQCG